MPEVVFHKERGHFPCLSKQVTSSNIKNTNAINKYFRLGKGGP